jgi:cell division septation protein DedD
MSDLTFPTPSSQNMELAAANRKLTTAILGMTLLTGLVACLAYLAGRTVTQIRNEPATIIRTEIPPPPVIVTPSPRPSPVVVAAAEAPAPSPVPAPTVAAPALPAPPTGLYLQVGLMNPNVDNSMRLRLQEAGFQVHLAGMEGSPASRVLVGPIASPAQQQQFEEKLREGGYQFFPRRY